MFDHTPLACVFFWFFLFLSGDLLTHTDSTLYARSGAQWLSELRRLWPSVPWLVACELISWLVPSLCLDRGIVSPLRLRWINGVHFRRNLPHAPLAEWPGPFACHCGNTGVERTPNKSQHRNLTLEKKIPPAASAGIRTRNLSITSPAL